MVPITPEFKLGAEVKAIEANRVIKFKMQEGRIRIQGCYKESCLGFRGLGITGLGIRG